MNYVYKHVDPRTGDVRYVGQGTKGRAWVCGSMGMDSGKRGNRTHSHQKWISELIALGYTPGDFVVVIAQALSPEAARKLEAEEIEKYDKSKLFNREYGLQSLKMTPDKLEIGRAARNGGATWAEAAAAAGVHKQTLWRALTNRTKAVKNV